MLSKRKKRQPEAGESADAPAERAGECRARPVCRPRRGRARGAAHESTKGEKLPNVRPDHTGEFMAWPAVLDLVSEIFRSKEKRRLRVRWSIQQAGRQTQGIAGNRRKLAGD